MDHQMNKKEVISPNHIEHPKQHKMYNSKTKCHYKRKYIISNKFHYQQYIAVTAEQRDIQESVNTKNPSLSHKHQEDPLTKHGKETP